MLFALSCVLAVLVLIGVKPRKEGAGDALSMEQTTVIRGIFAVIILLSHTRQYVTYTGALNGFAMKAITNIGQSMVAPFFFFSGYGVAYSYEKKEGYEKGFLKNRFLKLWLHFAIAVAAFLCMDLVLGKEFVASLGVDFNLKTVLLAFTGWESIGNSNWYVFDTLALYLVTFVAFLLTKLFYKRKSVKAAGAVVTALTLVLTVVLRYYRQPWTHWYDTLLTFAFGWWFFVFKDSVFAALKKPRVYYPVLVLSLAGYIALHRVSGVGTYNPYEYNMLSCLLVFLIVLVTTKIKIGNPVLTWLGKHSFQIYILMRIPMILLVYFGLNRSEWIFCAAAVPATLAVATLALAGEKLLDKLLFAKKEKKNVG